MKKISALFGLIFACSNISAGSYAIPFELINNLSSKGTVSIQAAQETCVAGFKGIYQFGEPVTEDSRVSIITQTQDVDNCGPWQQASWEFYIYYTPPGKKGGFFLASIGPNVGDDGVPAWALENANPNWLNITNWGTEDSDIFIISGTPPANLN